MFQFPSFVFSMEYIEQGGRMYFHRKTVFDCIGLESLVLGNKKGFLPLNAILTDLGLDFSQVSNFSLFNAILDNLDLNYFVLCCTVLYCTILYSNCTSLNKSDLYAPYCRCTCLTSRRCLRTSPPLPSSFCWGPTRPSWFF